MAKFCTKCGTRLADEMRFCNNCGASVTAAAPPGPPTPPMRAASIPPGPPATPGGVPAGPPPAKAGSPAAKIILIVVAIIAFLIVVSLGTCVYVGYRAKKKMEQTFKVDESGKSVTIQTPKGAITFGEGEALRAATVDVPRYPGSTPTEAGGEMSIAGTGGMSAQEFETSDSVDKVVAFYKDKFGSKIRVQEAEETAMFQFATNTGLTTVTITREEDEGKTKINISRIGK